MILFSSYMVSIVSVISLFKFDRRLENWWTELDLYWVGLIILGLSIPAPFVSYLMGIVMQWNSDLLLDHNSASENFVVPAASSD